MQGQVAVLYNFSVWYDFYDIASYQSNVLQFAKP
jgi:hypothetical protein